MAGGEHDRFGAATGIELVEDEREVVAHRFFADEEPAGDIPAGASLRQQLQHLVFPAGQLGKGRVGLRRNRHNRRLQLESVPKRLSGGTATDQTRGECPDFPRDICPGHRCGTGGRYGCLASGN
jgi:hypothetical protein